MQSRDDGDIGCFRWGIRGALCAAPSSPFARFAFYSQRPIVACSMKQMHIERVLFRRVPSVDTYENSSVCRRQWVSGRVARHSSRVFTYQSGERSIRTPRLAHGLENAAEQIPEQRLETKFSTFSKFRVENNQRHHPSSRRICQRREEISLEEGEAASIPNFPTSGKGAAINKPIHAPPNPSLRVAQSPRLLSSNNPNLQVSFWGEGIADDSI